MSTPKSNQTLRPRNQQAGYHQADTPFSLAVLGAPAASIEGSAKSTHHAPQYSGSRDSNLRTPLEPPDVFLRRSRDRSATLLLPQLWVDYREAVNEADQVLLLFHTPVAALEQLGEITQIVMDAAQAFPAVVAPRGSTRPPDGEVELRMIGNLPDIREVRAEAIPGRLLFEGSTQQPKSGVYRVSFVHGELFNSFEGRPSAKRFTSVIYDYLRSLVAAHEQRRADGWLLSSEQLITRIARLLLDRDQLVAQLAKAYDDLDVANARVDQLEDLNKVLMAERYGVKERRSKKTFGNLAIVAATLLGPLAAVLLDHSLSDAAAEAHDASTQVIIDCGGNITNINDSFNIQGDTYVIQPPTTLPGTR